MNQKNSPGEVQQAIRQGAMTREYKADAQRIVQALNGLRSTEIMSYLQYMQHQYMAVSLLSVGKDFSHPLEMTNKVTVLSSRTE